MSRMFCTLQEAAETLHANEEQIRTLVEQGVLHEFREGPHRLLKEAEIGALALVQQCRSEAPQPLAAPKDAHRPPARPRARRREDRRHRTEDRRRRRPSSGEARLSKSALRTPACVPRPHRTVPAEARIPPARPVTFRPSVRQWFWIGLVQDHPVVIALLSGFVLLALSALGAGLCWLAERS
jgi:hypothetical protein